jgi:hypothetical protein
MLIKSCNICQSRHLFVPGQFNVTYLGSINVNGEEVEVWCLPSATHVL